MEKERKLGQSERRESGKLMELTRARSEIDISRKEKKRPPLGLLASHRILSLSLHFNAPFPPSLPGSTSIRHVAPFPMRGGGAERGNCFNRKKTFFSEFSLDLSSVCLSQW